MDNHVTIYAWTAKRAGSTITITGKDKDGAPLKVVGVSYITLEDTRPIAVANGKRYWLGHR